MFNNGFPKEWSTLRKLAWLYRTVINAVSAVLKTVTGNPIHITDALAKPAQALSVKLEPIQDLHGYDNPWPAGGGKNLYNADAIPNSSSGGITATVNNGVITLNGTATSNSYFTVSNTGLSVGTYKFSFNNAIANSDVRVSFRNSDGTYFADAGCDTVNKTLVISNDEPKTVIIYIRSGAVLTNYVIKPQLEVGTAATDFAPFANICPISGHTDADVTRTGAQLFDKNAADKQAGWAIDPFTFIVYQTGSGNYNLSGYVPIKGGQSYIVSGSTRASDVVFFDKDKTAISGYSSFSPRTAPNNAEYLRFDYWKADEDTVMLNLGSSASPYQPYVGTTHPIPLGQTVYGGTLDVTTGKLTVDRKTVTFNGSEAWAAASTSQAQQGYYLATNAMPKLRYYGNSIKCDKLKTFDNNAEQNYTAAEYGITGYYDYATGYPKRNWIYAKAASIVSDTPSFKQWLANNPITVSYPLATPQTIQLTPQQVELLQGENNIWSDGEMTLVYLADGNASDVEALNILLGGRYVNNHTKDEPTDREALDILLGGNTR